MPYANGTGISTYHLSDNPRLYEPSRSNAFEFLITGIDQLLPAGMQQELASEVDYMSNVQEIIALSVAETSIPHFELQTIEIRRGNSSMKFAGAPNFGSGTIRCNDYVGVRTKDVLLAWQALAYDVKDDVVQLAPRYKHDCKLVEYAPDFSRILRTWTLKGCWVRSLSEGNFTHDTVDKRTIDITIEYDRAIPEIVDET